MSCVLPFVFSLLVNDEMLTNGMNAASTKTVPLRWSEKVRSAVTDKLTSVRRRVTNEKLIFDLAFTQSLQKFDDHEVKFNGAMDENYLSYWRFDLKCEAPLGMWFGKVWFRGWS